MDTATLLPSMVGLRLMPQSYYSFEGGIDWPVVAGQLLLQDGQ
jgi:hypothetical protein